MLQNNWIADDLLAFDLETTGIDVFSDVPVSYALIRRSRTHNSLRIDSQTGLINPERPIPQSAMDVHGISDDVAATGTPLVAAIDMLASTISEAWSEGAAVVGMNVAYDLTMVDSACRRLGLRHFDDRGGIGPVLDVMVLDRHLDQWRKGRRTLTHLCEVYGVVNTQAHAALGDAAASLDVLDAIVSKYPELRDMSLEELTSSLEEWYFTWISGLSSWKVKKGEDPIDEGRFYWPIHRESVDSSDEAELSA